MPARRRAARHWPWSGGQHQLLSLAALAGAPSGDLRRRTARAESGKAERRSGAEQQQLLGDQVRAIIEVPHLSAVALGGQLANEHEEDPFFFLSLRLPVPEPVDRDFFRPLVRGS